MKLMSLWRVLFVLAAVSLSCSSALAVESLPAGAWSYAGLQMESPPDAIATPLHRDFVAVSGGESHSMALTRDGRVVVWGGNFNNQLDLPASVSRGVSAIAAGGRFSAALKNGAVIVWGGSSPLQLAVPVAASSGVVTIAAGWNHMLALKTDGSVVAWGNNESGQCSVPSQVSANITAIAAGYSHSLALTAGGEVIAWGTDRPGAPAGLEAVVPEAARSGVIAIAANFRYSVALKADGSVIEWGSGIPVGEVDYHAQAGSGISGIANGYHHLAFLHHDGSVSAILQEWMFDYGQAVVPPAALSGVVAIAAGNSHNLALKEDGTVVAWGGGNKETPGDLIVAYPYRGQSAVPAVLGSEVSAVAVAFTHTLALTEEGDVHAWGFNNYGQTAVPLEAQTGVKAVAVGTNHSVALRTDGRVVAWGSNLEGQCDVPAGALSGVKAIASANAHTVALKDDGSVIGWGNNYMDGLAVPPEAQSGVVAITAGYEFAVALKEDGTTVAWGATALGVVTIPVEAQAGVVAIAAGADHALALTAEGRVVAWGWNFFGQTNVPEAALSGVVAIAAGESHSVALKEDGTIVTWGSNYELQRQPGFGSGKVSAIAAGGSATFWKVALPWPSFDEAAAIAGLAGAAAEPEAMPFGDGVPNLLKHAFNLSLAGPYAGEIANGTSAGLPSGRLIRDEAGSRWRIEFLRRKDPRLTYTPLKATGLAAGSFSPTTGPPEVEEIPGFPAWERVTIEEPVDFSMTPRFFSRVRVE